MWCSVITGTDRSRPDNQSGFSNQANLNKTSNPKQLWKLPELWKSTTDAFGTSS
jgi:hypothetical protein